MLGFVEEEKGVILCIRRAVSGIRSSMNMLLARGFYNR